MKVQMKKLVSVAILTIASFVLFGQTHEDQNYYDVNSGNERGIRFWGGSDWYSLSMGSGSYYNLGHVSDVALKMTMTGVNNRGFVWGERGAVPIASLSLDGHFQIKNSFYFDGITGRLGIGTTLPENMLHVEGQAKITDRIDLGEYLSGISTGLNLFDRTINFNYDNSGLFGAISYKTAEGNTSPNQTRYFIMFNVENNNSYPIFTNRTPNGKLVFKTGTTNGGSEIERLVMEGGNGTTNTYFNNTNVGIGTDYIPSGYKLAVNGDIIAERVTIKLKASWPDYVFADNYELKPLTEVKAFIQENSHLPEVPSAKEVEENGVDLGDMDAVLLKKIEEMTLYIIQLEERISELEK